MYLQTEGGSLFATESHQLTNKIWSNCLSHVQDGRWMMKFFMALKSALDAECKHVYATCPSWNPLPAAIFKVIMTPTSENHNVSAGQLCSSSVVPAKP